MFSPFWRHILLILLIPLVCLLDLPYVTFFQENKFLLIMYKYALICLDSYILVYD